MSLEERWYYNISFYENFSSLRLQIEFSSKFCSTWRLWLCAKWYSWGHCGDRFGLRGALLWKSCYPGCQPQILSPDHKFLTLSRCVSLLPTTITPACPPRWPPAPPTRSCAWRSTTSENQSTESGSKKDKTKKNKIRYKVSMLMYLWRHSSS